MTPYVVSPLARVHRERKGWALAKRTRRQLLAEFKRAKYDRSLQEVENLLSLYGFIERAASKEASVWNRGSVGLTLPKPKTGGGSLLVCYVSLAIRKIEEAERLGIPEEVIS